jgi:hypothetical protein
MPNTPEPPRDRMAVLQRRSPQFNEPEDIGVGSLVRQGSTQLMVTERIAHRMAAQLNAANPGDSWTVWPVPDLDLTPADPGPIWRPCELLALAEADHPQDGLCYWPPRPCDTRQGQITTRTLWGLLGAAYNPFDPGWYRRIHHQRFRGWFVQ